MIAGQLRHIIETSALVGRVEDVMKLALPAVSMRTAGVELQELSLGASRMGGLPDLPPDTDWPISRGRPLEFLAQIDLAQAAAFYALPDMPASGWLAAFYNLQASEGAGSLSAGDWRIHYFDGEAASLIRREPPSPTAAVPRMRGHFGWLFGRGQHQVLSNPEPTHRFEACALEFDREDCLPTVFDLVQAYGPKDPGGADEAWEDLDERLESPDHGPFHRLGGYPMLVQSKMSDIAGWKLLLQIDSDEAGPDWMWGDAGRLYFLIRPDDLRKRRFECAWCSEEFY